ncbi:MAG: DNA translocase FtsK 4TM domain-containing protein [Magnetococcales bacterium]|nr:DNA translocase FtsK 4TM domain-containing protein [Magnetococcales bacterium]
MGRKQNKSNEQEQQTMENRRTVFREGMAVLLFGIAAYLTIALYSYNVHDPSFNNTGSGRVTNLGGVVGAYLADFLLQLFGYSSVWVPLFFALTAFFAMRQTSSGLSWEQIGTLPLLAVVTTILSVMFQGEVITYMPAGPGGLAGMMVTRALTQTLGYWGSLLLLIMLGVLSFMVLTRLSLFNLLKWIKDCVVALFGLFSWRSTSETDSQTIPEDFQNDPTHATTEHRISDIKATEIPPFRFRDLQVPEIPEKGFHAAHEEVIPIPHEPHAEAATRPVEPVLTEQMNHDPEPQVAAHRLAAGKLLAPVAGLVAGSMDKVTSILKRPEKEEKNPDWLRPMAFDPHPNANTGRQEPALDEVSTGRQEPALDDVSGDATRDFRNTDAFPEREEVFPDLNTTPLQDQDSRHSRDEADFVIADESLQQTREIEPDMMVEPEVTPPDETDTTRSSFDTPAPEPIRETAPASGSWIIQALAEKRKVEPDTERSGDLGFHSEEALPLAAGDPDDMPQPDLTPFASSHSDTTRQPFFDRDDGDDFETQEMDFELPGPNDEQNDGAPGDDFDDDFEDQSSRAGDIGNGETLFRAGQTDATTAGAGGGLVASFPLPSLDLLEKPTVGNNEIDRDYLTQQARLLELKLADFKIKGQITNVIPGPVVTTFEFDPAPGLRASKVVSISDDLARSILSPSVRVVGNIPGKNVIGVEIPNQTRSTVYLREILESEVFIKTGHPLAVALGSDITGNPVVANLAKMPHLLVAGTTGSGKSVALNAMICSILFSARPDQVRFLMVDPKMLELSIYEGIPHLLAPVVTDVHKAAKLLKWAVQEMEDRYRLMSEVGVRSLDSFNRRMLQCQETGERPTRRVKIGIDPETGTPVEQEEPIPLNTKPLIVIVIDELADLMIQVGKEVEPAIARLAQMARAAGLHLIIATQRPSVDVITGLIKANFPTRLAFQVSSKIDSRTILDAMGAERLLGMGDGLYLPPGTSHLKRIHAPLVTDDEVHHLVGYLKSISGAPKYDMAVMRHADDDDDDSDLAFGNGQDDMEPIEEDDPLYRPAVALVQRLRKVSTSMVQRHFKIGYNRAARIVERMESEGLVTPSNSAGKREVLNFGQHGD